MTMPRIQRRRFIAQATIAMGVITTLGLCIPVDAVDAASAENDTWWPLRKDEFASLQASTDKPIKVFFVDKDVTELDLAPKWDYVWAVHLSNAEKAELRLERPELFGPTTEGGVPFEVGTLGFLVLSPICPHLGCRYAWSDSLGHFQCPCHGSQFTKLGAHASLPDGSFVGPSPRGLDPLPFRKRSATAEVEWIRYEINAPTRLIVSMR